MPVILVIYLIFNNYYVKDIWGYVIFFSTFLCESFIVILLDYLCLTLRSHLMAKNKISIQSNTSLNTGKRNYSTGRGNSKKGSRKTLSSPESKPYEDLYTGRGVPEYEPIWVKDNGKERSPFGASWAQDKKDRLSYPSNYPCNYINISDPYHNRKLIKDTCKGNRVVYIWTYKPTGICLVGSSSNSVERVLSYFEKKSLFLDTRRGVQFLADVNKVYII